MAIMPDKSEIGQWPFGSNEFLEGKCHLCDNKAVAFWSARKDLLICETCAIKILPSLIVDAMSNVLRIDEVKVCFKQAFHARDQGFGGHARKSTEELGKTQKMKK